MRFHLRAPGGEFLWLARLLRQEGHEAVLALTQGSRVGEGLCGRVGLSAAAEAGSTVLATPEGLQRRETGVIGGPLGHGNGLARLERAGCAVPDWHRFPGPGDAARFLDSRRAGAPGRRWCCYPEDSPGAAVDGPAALLRRLLRGVPGFGPVIVQEVLPDGVRIRIEGWYDGSRWVLPFTAAFTERAFMPGPEGSDGLGSRAMAQRVVAWALAGSKPELAGRTVMLLGDELEEAGYVGPVAICAVVDRQGTPFAYELVQGIDQDSLRVVTALWQPGSVGKQLAAFGEGDLGRFSMQTDLLAGSLRVSIPPAPIADPQRAAERMGWPLDPWLLEHPRKFLLDDVMERDGQPVCAGRDGSVVIITTVGPELEDVDGELLQLADDLDIPEKQYRTDPCTGADRDWRRLRGWGLLTGPPEHEPPKKAAGDEDEPPNDGGTPEALEPALPDPYGEFL